MKTRVKTSRVELSFERAETESYIAIANNYTRAQKHGKTVRQMTLSGIKEIVDHVVEAHNNLENNF